MKKLAMMMGVAALAGPMTAAERAKGRYMRDEGGHPPQPRAPIEMKSWIEGVEKKLTQHGVDAKSIDEIKARVEHLEQKSARRAGGGSGDGAPSIGKQFTSEKGRDVKGMRARDRVSFETKATITSSVANAAGSAGALVVPQRDTLTMLPKRRLTIRNLLNVIQVTSGSVEYPRQQAGTNAAGMVAEGAAKPQSDMKFDMATAPIRTIAHHMKASRQILDDEPQLEGMIDIDLRYGLALREESQLLYGDGTGQNLLGMMPQSTDFLAPIVMTDANEIDTIGLAILQASLTDVPPDGIVIHPADWWKMRLTKDADGRYILGDPMTNVAPNLFGLPVVPTQAMASGDFLVGAFNVQTLYDRWEARVEVGFENDDFTKNLVTILGEERVGFAAKQPQALINGSFATAP
ncbi:conserved exported hypothetical protein [Sphingomonas sp. EC-HK361]|uniref:phage major capsid protein n=1 Tax=Sphingomonas sp. EC-HK361 TaxID=2038397 RepID=UPI001257CED1|nr:phage major capsid protein [Sphingomonas sp. EC-HK361]VVT16383.1 conserved exported hypothetical protein [Sphingomonas sp. EC-HK361]